MPGSRPNGLSAPLPTAPARARRRIRNNLWGMAQQSLAAGLAWAVAARLADDHAPFFAPIAAVVAMNTTIGGRGRQALNLFLGVAVGIVAGAGALALLGTRQVALPLATFVALMVAAGVGAARVTIAQSAASAILTVSIPYGAGGGPLRLFDAGIGVLVALTFSQVLFPPHPLRLVERARTSLLSSLRRLMRTTIARLGNPNEERSLRPDAEDARRALDDLDRAHQASHNVVHHTLLWARYRKPQKQLADVVEVSAGLASATLVASAAFNRVAPEHREIVLPIAQSLVAALEETVAHNEEFATAVSTLRERHARVRSTHGHEPDLVLILDSVKVLIDLLEQWHSQ